MKIFQYKVSVLFLKYAPVIGAFIMFLHVFLLITNKNKLIADWTFSLPIIPAITAMIWSKTFGFCIMHRLFIVYICAISYCIKFEQAIGFGSLLLFSRWFLFIIGAILFIWLLVRFKQFHYQCLNKEDVKVNKKSTIKNS